MAIEITCIDCGKTEATFSASVVRCGECASKVSAGMSAMRAAAKAGQKQAATSKARSFDRLYNEGGEGYNPYRNR